MIKEGMFVRCPIDREYPHNPRVFATGKVISINLFNETAHIEFSDPFDQKKYFEYIPDEVQEAPLEALDHCHLFKNSVVKYGRKTAIVVEYKGKEDELYDYYLQDSTTKEYCLVNEKELMASFISGSANPTHQLKKYEFQNPCWYLGRQIVKDTMNILDNSILGFKELAGCKIYLKAFQLNTIMQCLQNDYCRYMIADEVGLGKTIEACSVLKIYLSNKANQNVLITVPRALVAQWRTELLFKFGLVEGENDNSITILAVEDLTKDDCMEEWNFIVVDEVHNYLRKRDRYEYIHALSRNSENVILLSATPIQQRQEEYLDLLRLILPEKYDDISIEKFSELVEKQNKISRLTYSLLDEVDSFKNELLPEIEADDPHEDEDVQEELEVIEKNLGDLVDIINDETLSDMVSKVDTTLDDFGLYDIQVIVSYICDNFQIERNIIRGRRAVLGVYPKDPEGEFAERAISEIEYEINEETNYYENEAYRQLKEWILSLEGELQDTNITEIIQPLIEAFFSSPWAYNSRLSDIGNKISIPERVIKTASRWLDDENEAVNNIANVMDDVEGHPSRMLKLVSYIDENLFDEKVVVFTDQIETFDAYYDVFKQIFGEEVTGFAESIDRDEAEINIFRFQSEPDCKILLCDKSGGEGRNLQIADCVIHVDLPWNVNTIEQRIGRLDRMGRDVEKPVTSIVVHTVDSYEEQLFKLWNEGLNVFCQSLSGLEIIMNDINNKIVDSIKQDFEFGLYRLIPELIKEAETMRETVQREQIFDTAAMRFRPLCLQLEKLLMNYQFNENDLFADTMMSWASLAGFGELHHGKNDGFVAFDENNFSVRSAQNSFLIPPNWEHYISKKQNEVAIKAQRGLEEEKAKNTTHDNRTIMGTFDRQMAIKNDYIHFYAPGDEIFDCIVENAMRSYKGMCTALAAQSCVDWKGFVYTYSIEPNERLLLDAGVSLYALGMFRQYLASSMQIIPVGFSAFSEVPDKIVLSEHKRLTQLGYFNRSDSIDHLGRRGKEDGFLGIPSRFRASNLDWFKGQYTEEKWGKLVDQSSQIARKRAIERFQRESNLTGAKEMIAQILSMKESHANYYGTSEADSIKELKQQYETIYESLSKPIIRLEAACFMWLLK
mgnify:FL=1